MNVTELARRLKISTNDLLEWLPELGFDIGRRAIKVDDRTAWRIIESWPRLLKQWQKLHPQEAVVKLTEANRVAVEIELPTVLTVREFAARLGLPVTRVLTELMKNGILAALNERIDFTTSSIIAQDLGYQVKGISAAQAVSEEETVKDFLRERLEKEDRSLMQARPPVVVVMGHVDHGKTTLLDALRKTNVASGEAGGITQHIGAYQALHKERRVTFIDTPGHEAFTAMRSRGARVADVAILIVAADDGVQPQTLEALKIIAAAKLPMVVAINKVDKTGADLERVKRALAEQGILGEEWGGQTPFVPISAKIGTGLARLMEIILLLADLDKDRLLANPESRAMGTVVEAHVDPGEGPVATVLVQNGTLRRKDYLAVGLTLYGRVRAMKDWSGKFLTAALPGQPVRVLGFKVAPEVGDLVEVPENYQKLETKKVLSTYKKGMVQIAPVKETSATTPEPQKFVNVIVKADMLGSLEAILSKLETMQTSEVAVKMLAKGLGNITETEILQAEAAKAIVYGFNVAVLPAVADLARDKGVEIQIYKLIYELLGDVRGRLEILLAPEIIHTDFGKLKVLAVFRKERQYAIIGGRVEEGKAIKGAKVKIVRAGVSEGEGQLAELQSAKQAVESVPGGSECGLKISTRIPVEVGDVLEIYKEEKKERKLAL